MREQLAKINGSRARFEGIFVRFGSKKNWHGYPEPTCLLRDIKSLSENKIVTDHLWFSCGKRLESLNLQEGDVVRFDARVTPYVKGYRGYRDDVYDAPIETDYRLSFPTKLIKIPKENSGEVKKLL